jgi:hypothetical protein
MILHILYLFLLLITLIIGLKRKNNFGEEYLFLRLLLIITFIVEFIAFIMLRFYKINTTIIFHFFYPVEFILIALFYQKSISNTFVKKVALISIVMHPIISVYWSLYVQRVGEYNSYVSMLSAILIIFYSSFLIFELFRKQSQKLFNVPSFWISTGLLFFYAGSFFIMGILNYLLKNDKSTATQLFLINQLLNFLLYSLYIIGFLCKPQTKI